MKRRLRLFRKRLALTGPELRKKFVSVTQPIEGNFGQIGLSR